MANAHNLDDWELLAQFSHVFRSVSDGFTDQVDMHRGQSMLLCTVCKADGMTQTEIADLLSIQGATVTNMLQRMEEAGWVVRRRDLNDNRLVRVYITDNGRQKEMEIQEQFMQMQAMLFAGMSDADRANLRRLMQKLLQNMSEPHP